MQAIKATNPQAQDKYGLNCKGLFPAMETVNAKKIFKQSVDKHNLYYTLY